MRSVRVARVSEEIKDRSRYAQTGHGIDRGAIEGRRADREGAVRMSRRKVQDVEVEKGSGNVYADLGYVDADEILIQGPAHEQDCADHQTEEPYPDPSCGIAWHASAQTFQSVAGSVPGFFGAAVDGLVPALWLGVGATHSLLHCQGLLIDSARTRKTLGIDV